MVGEEAISPIGLILPETNEVADDDQNSVVDATEPPSIYTWTESRLELNGAAAQLTCRARGHPTPLVSWLDADENPVTDETPGFTVSFAFLCFGTY